MAQVLDIGVPSSRTLTAGVGLAGGGLLAANPTLTVAIPQINGFRLTLTTAVPVTTADVTGATTIYWTPYKGGMVALYDGAAWALYSSAEISLALGTLTSGLPYDVFVYNNAGTLTLEFLAWTNGTTRATALVMTNGVWLKTGALTRRYVGTFYTTATTTTEDSAANRFLWNVDNRVQRSMNVSESTVSWAYTTAAFRQANGNAANQIAYVAGLAVDMVSMAYNATGSSNNGSYMLISIGTDSTTIQDPSVGNGRIGTASIVSMSCTYTGEAKLGYHYLAALEYAVASGTATWYGGTSFGITGTVMS